MARTQRTSLMRRSGLVTHRCRGRVARGLTVVLVPAQVLLGVPVTAAPRGEPVSAAAREETTAPPAPPKVDVNRTRPQVQRPPLYPVFTSEVSDEQIVRARVFGEPLSPLGSGNERENKALAAAITAYLKAGDPEQTEPLEAFLRRNAGSVWRASLLANLGMVYERTGHFGRAERALEEAWRLARDASDRPGRVVADQAVGELLELRMQFGNVEGLETLLEEIGERELIGGAMERLRDARASAWALRNLHETALPSGSIALERLLIRARPGERRHEAIRDFHAKPEGASLQEVEALSAEIGLDLEMAQREPNAELVIPAVIHLKPGHFAALVREEGGRYLLDDPLLGGDVWLSRSALEEEASGYFLVPRGTARPGWQKPDRAAAEKVRGKCIIPVPFAGNTGQPHCQLQNQCGTSPRCLRPNELPCDCGTSGAMAIYSFHTARPNLHISDTPVGYSPPRGPQVRFGVYYNHREFYQPLTFYFSNLGEKWAFDWLSYLEDDPANPSAQVSLYVRGGGLENYSGFVNGTSAPQQDNQAVVVRTSSNPIQYERRLADGGVEVFTVSDGAASYPRRVFMTQARDPQGNAISFTYDAQLRLVSVTDAISQVSTLSYDLIADPLKITKVTDPFGRSASFEYDAQGRLVRITDVIGIKSEFSYGSGGFVSALTTPYGTTQFSWGNAPNPSTDFWVQAIDPLGGTERINFVYSTSAIPNTDPASVVPTGFNNHNANLGYSNTFYWNKRAWMLYPGDFTKAVVTKWTFSANMKLDKWPHSAKPPLENRVWYDYWGAPGYDWVGPIARPAKTATVLDDGTSQINRYEYNSRGRKTRQTDPLGRETLYEYDTNEIDLLRGMQKNGSNYDLLETRTYNAQREPLTVTDAAAQVTTFTYNTQGQVLTVVTPPRAGLSQAQRTTTYAYDTNGYLQSVTGPLAGATTSYTHDGYGRVRTVTDSDSYTLTYDYDVLDRQTRVTYPDGAYEQTVFNRLDPEKQRDRMGRWTETFHDPLRRVVATRDPIGRTTTQQWCTCGSLDRLVDPKGNATSWDRDVQGRVTKETRADGSFWETTYETTTSRVKKVKDAKGQETQYTYFLDGKVEQLSYPNAQIATPSVSYTYHTAYGRLATMVDGTGTTSYNYHPIAGLGAGQVASIDGPLSNDTISYSYEELGRVASRALNGTSTTWVYDLLGRLTTLTDPLGDFTHAYVSVTGRLSSLTYPNGQVSNYAYLTNAGDKRLQEIHHRVSAGGTTLSKFNYLYDAEGSITQWTQQYGTAAANAYDLSYDGAEQLVSGVYKTTDPTPVVLKRYGYAYDPAGNRTTEQIDDAPMQATFDNRNRLTSQQPGGALLFKGSLNEPATVTVAGTPATVDAANKFQGTAPVVSGTSNVVVTATDPSGNLRTNTYQVTISGSTKTFTYDANGSLTGEGAKTYEWDGADRLVRVLDGGNEVVRFVYDGEGRRSQKIAAGVTHTYVYDGEDILEERLSTGATTRYVHGPGIDQPLAKVEAGAASYYLADHLGSIVQVTNASATVTLTRQYDPWGNPLQGSTSEGYAFTGREWDPEAAFHYYRTRYYDARMARFIAEDSITWNGDGPNLYGYVLNSPVNRTDPFGRESGDLWRGWMDPEEIKTLRNPPLRVPTCEDICVDFLRACNFTCAAAGTGTTVACFITCAGASRGKAPLCRTVCVVVGQNVTATLKLACWAGYQACLRSCKEERPCSP
jgi:RHS repeat-associated protein